MRSHSGVSFRAAGALVVLACVLAACGGGGVATTPVPSATPDTDVTAATNTFCITPSTSAQAVSVPNTGGFTGTLSIGAAASAAASCDVNVTVASGADAAVPSGVTAAALRRIAATNPANGPIWSISLSNAYIGGVEMTGATLNTPSAINYPDGTYYAVVTDGNLPPTVLQFTAKNGVLVLASTGLPLTVLPGSTLTLYLYAHGIVPNDSNLPTASPAPSASASAGATASPTASPAPTASPTVTPLPSPTAIPTYTAVITLSPSGCTAFGNAGGTQTYTAQMTTTAPPGTQLYYIWSNPVQNFFTYTFPSAPVSIGIGLNGSIATTTNSVTITVPTYPQGTLAGVSGGFSVNGAYYNPQTQTGESFRNNAAGATAYVAAGIATCPP